MPTFPLASITKGVVSLAESSTMKLLPEPVFWTVSFASGVVEPTPKLKPVLK